MTNPCRSTPASTCGEVTYQYDGLNRVTGVTEQDGSVVYTYYGANVSSNGGSGSQMCSGYGVGYPILSLDEAGTGRQSWTDAFGRLIEVDEPDPASGSLTSGSPTATCYAYDLNNNLTQVVENGSRTRSFTYDSLSRLTQAVNPESGTINYTYDADGNVTTKTSPQANQTGSATTTLSFCYDGLNRMTSKAYTNQSCPQSSPAAVYSYDQSSVWGNSLSNPIGRLTFTQIGSTTTADLIMLIPWAGSTNTGSASRPLADTNSTTATIYSGTSLPTRKLTVFLPKHCTRASMAQRK